MSDKRELGDRTVLVTGGVGFIGSHLIRVLLRNHPEVRIINLDRLTYAGSPENLREIEDRGRYEFIKGDIRDKELVRSLLSRVQYVFHLAAETHVDRSIRDAGEFVLTNVYGTFTLLEESRHCPGVEAFIHVSTDEVYGSRDKGLFGEGDPLSPSSPYAASKAGAEGLARAYHVTYGLPIVIVRPCNHFGPNQHPEKFVPLFVTNALDDEPLPLYGEGTNVREWLYVEDGCRAIETALLKGSIGEVYNIGSGKELSNIDVAGRLLALLGKSKDLIRFVPDRLGHDRRYALDSAKIRDIGWIPETPYEQALEMTVRWYEENPAWWRGCKEARIGY
jgi:dTDP-glucose 4,6-dehydratase